MRVKYSALIGMNDQRRDREFVKAAIKFQQQYAPFVQVDDEPKSITACDHGKTWNCGQCAWLDRSQLNEELLERSVLPTGHCAD